MKILLITLVFITTLLGTESIWGDDYEKALVQAKNGNKDVYMLITSVNCRWCRKFEDTPLKDQKTMQRLK